MADTCDVVTLLRRLREMRRYFEAGTAMEKLAFVTDRPLVTQSGHRLRPETRTTSARRRNHRPYGRRCAPEDIGKNVVVNVDSEGHGQLPSSFGELDQFGGAAAYAGGERLIYHRGRKPGGKTGSAGDGHEATPAQLPARHLVQEDLNYFIGIAHLS